MEIVAVPPSLRDLDNFGENSAEDDAVLDYFIETESVSAVENDNVFLVLGRKGSGKTAIVRYFTEGENQDHSVALNLSGYPWSVHASRMDRGASDIDAYVASWKYCIAVEIAGWVMKKSAGQYHDNQRALRDFFDSNYGGQAPSLSDVLRPKTLKLKGLEIAPSIMGNQLCGVALERSGDDLGLGHELNALTESLVQCIQRIILDCHLPTLFLHFDELDHGLQLLDSPRSAMITGLVIAVRDLRRAFRELKLSINITIYLRTDIWDDLSFSDKNKITQGQSLYLEWDSKSLQKVIDKRIKAKIDQKYSWEDIIDDKLMRGSQKKWNHIVSRTLRRPRDVIQFCNTCLNQAKKRQEEPLVLTNEDVVEARKEYSTYLKRELNDEIDPHWPQWEEALQACSAIATETFEKEQFVDEYNKRRSRQNSVDADGALKLMHRFSIIGYRTGSGYGGSGWAFLFEDPDAGWDSAAKRFKVHPGLKEYAKLREERA